MKTALECLAWSVRSLVQSAHVQKTLFPSFVELADELALTFEEHYRSSFSKHHHEWSTEQLSALRTLDEKLATMSGPNKEDLWTADECLDHAEWSEVRCLAKAVVHAFGWSIEAPPPSDAIYVSGKKEPNQPLQRNASTGSVSNFESPARRG